MSEYEKINQPQHYQGGNISTNDVIREFNLNFALGNVVKYVLRAGRKPDASTLEDLNKALWYLRDEIKERKPDSSGLEGLAARTSSTNWGRVINDD